MKETTQASNSTDRLADERVLSPVRIQRSRRKGFRMPENTVYVGRGSKWGNPFRVGDYVNDFWFAVFDDIDTLTYFTRSRKVPNNEEAVRLFEKYNMYELSDEGALNEIKGKNLSCWCPLDKPCHADVLLRLANGR